MNSSTINEAIRRFYPTVVHFDNVDFYATSPKVLLRRKQFEEAVRNNTAWETFKEDIVSSLSIEKVTDYSNFAMGPAYWLAFAIMLDDEVVEISIVISVICDYWSYRFVDKQSIPGCRYEIVHNEERDRIDRIFDLVKEHFPRHEFLAVDVHQIVIPGTRSFYTNAPTIFQAVFID